MRASSILFLTLFFILPGGVALAEHHDSTVSDESPLQQPGAYLTMRTLKPEDEKALKLAQAFAFAREVQAIKRKPYFDDELREFKTLRDSVYDEKGYKEAYSLLKADFDRRRDLLSGGRSFRSTSELRPKSAEQTLVDNYLEGLRKLDKERQASLLKYIPDQAKRESFAELGQLFNALAALDELNGPYHEVAKRFMPEIPPDSLRGFRRRF